MLLTLRQADGPLLSTVMDTPVGRLRISARGGALVSIGWTESDRCEEAPTPILSEAVSALRRYFQSANASLALPLHPAGTPYQRRVWQRLAEIPPGQVVSYGQLARELGSGARAVAAACRANPYPLVVPCHRVVASNGLGGYCGASDGPWPEIKRWLLAHEGCGYGRSA